MCDEANCFGPLEPSRLQEGPKYSGDAAGLEVKRGVLADLTSISAPWEAMYVPRFLVPHAVLEAISPPVFIFAPLLLVLLPAASLPLLE